MISRLLTSTTIIFVLLSFKPVTAQHFCIDWSSIDFSDLKSNGKSPSTKNTKFRTRKKNWLFKWGINSLILLERQPEKFSSYGLKLGIYKMIDRNQRWALGVDAGLGFYGRDKDDLDFPDYDKYKLEQKTYELNAVILYRWLNLRRFHSYAGVFAGLLGVRTTSHLRRKGTYNNFLTCETEKTDKIGSFSEYHPNIGVVLGLEYVFRNSVDKLFFEASYQNAGEIEYVAKKNTETVDNPNGKFPLQINFETNTSIFRLLSPRIGFSHYF